MIINIKSKNQELLNKIMHNVKNYYIKVNQIIIPMPENKQTIPKIKIKIQWQYSNIPLLIKYK